MPAPEVQAVEVSEEKPGTGRAPKLVQVVRIPGLDADSFAAMDAHILPDGHPPEQITFHVNGPIDGGWCVVDAWDSKEARDRFLEERIRPAAGGGAAQGRAGDRGPDGGGHARRIRASSRLVAAAAGIINCVSRPPPPYSS